MKYSFMMMIMGEAKSQKADPGCDSSWGATEAPLLTNLQRDKRPLPTQSNNCTFSHSAVDGISTHSQHSHTFLLLLLACFSR